MAALVEPDSMEQIGKPMIEAFKTVEKDAEAAAKEILEKSKEDLKGLDKNSCEVRVQLKVDEYKNRLCEYLDKASNYILEHAVPKKPLREEFSSDEEFESAMKLYDLKVVAFNLLFDQATIALDNFLDKLEGFLGKLVATLKKIWELIIKGLEVAAEIIQDCLGYLRKVLYEWFTWGVGLLKGSCGM